MANVVVGVTGGIAAYKSAPLIRLFSEAGHSVQVVATTNAFKFIGKATLEALSKNPVSIVDPDLFTDVDQVKHIAISKNADLIVVAPATASFIAKVAAGIADDLLTTTVLAATVPVVIAPAMHTEMWENPATKNNIDTLIKRGLHIVSPGVGRLTGQDTGVGRLAEPEQIFSEAISSISSGPLAGLRVLVTAGGTREPIDAARFIGNFSSGKQGIAFARAARAMGAEVHIIAVNIAEELLGGFQYTAVQTTLELQAELTNRLDWFDVLVMAAAVSDFTPDKTLTTKLKRADIGQTLEVSLHSNPDLLKAVVEHLKSSGRTATTVGFAAEASSDLEKLARQKLDSKDCDYIVANDISGGAVFGSDQTSIILVSKNQATSFAGSKLDVAKQVLGVLASKLGKL